MSRSSLTPLLLAAGALGAALLAGCGGGGRQRATTTPAAPQARPGLREPPAPITEHILPVLNADVIGKVTDAQGNGVPGVTIVPRHRRHRRRLARPGRLPAEQPDRQCRPPPHRLGPERQHPVYGQHGGPDTEQPPGLQRQHPAVPVGRRQATIGGTVRNAAGTPISGVRVFLALPNGSAQVAGNYSSLIAYTDANGVYTIPNVPSDPPSGGALTIAASTPGQQNQVFTLAALQPGGSYSRNFTLNASTQQAVSAPSIAFVTTATEPTDSQSGRAIQAHLAGGPASVYDQIRRSLCPAYAGASARQAAVGKSLSAHLAAHAVGDYAVETDIAFDNPVQTGSVIGNTIYRTAGTTATAGVLPTESQSDAYDFLQDPLANYYTDVTFSTNTSTTAAGSQYNFALSATNTDGTETALSAIYSITPLGPLTLTAPIVGQLYAGTATITWSPASGAARYFVDVYDQYPSVGLTPVTSSAAIPAGTSSYAVTGLPGGQDYYVVVVGVADPVETLLPSATSSAAVTGGAQTYSQITRFHIQ